MGARLRQFAVVANVKVRRQAVQVQASALAAGRGAEDAQHGHLLGRADLRAARVSGKRGAAAVPSRARRSARAPAATRLQRRRLQPERRARPSKVVVLRACVRAKR